MKNTKYIKLFKDFKVNESTVDWDAYDEIIKSKTFKKLKNKIKKGSVDIDTFASELENELPDIDWGDTDIYRSIQCVYSETEQ